MNPTSIWRLQSTGLGAHRPKNWELRGCCWNQEKSMRKNWESSSPWTFFYLESSCYLSLSTLTMSQWSWIAFKFDSVFFPYYFILGASSPGRARGLWHQPISSQLSRVVFSFVSVYSWSLHLGCTSSSTLKVKISMTSTYKVEFFVQPVACVSAAVYCLVPLCNKCLQESYFIMLCHRHHNKLISKHSVNPILINIF